MTSSSPKSVGTSSSSDDEEYVEVTIDFTSNETLVVQTVESTESNSKSNELKEEVNRSASTSQLDTQVDSALSSREVVSARGRRRQLDQRNQARDIYRRAPNVSWKEIEMNFDMFAKDGYLLRIDFAECIGIRDSKEFALVLFDALSRRWRMKMDKIGKDELHEYWYQITDHSLESRLQLFFDMGDKDDDGRWNKDEVKEIIKLSASTCNLPRLEAQAEEYAAFIMDELDPERLGYIEIWQLDTLLFQNDEYLNQSDSCSTIDDTSLAHYRVQRSKTMDTLRTHVRKLGVWTYELLSWPKLRMDRKYDILLLIGFGKGTTPFISILKDLINNTTEKDDLYKVPELNMVSSKQKTPLRTTNAYFYGLNTKEDSFNLLKGVMNEVADLDHKGIVEMYNYLTSNVRAIHEEGDTRTFLIAIVAALFRLKNCVDIDSRTMVRTQFAKPNWKNVMSRLGTKHPNARIGVFYCGPPTLAKELSKLCDVYNQRGTAKFEFHIKHL